jgi:hypothetical protein
MGKLSRKLKKCALLVVAVVNSTLPILLLSAINVPLGLVVGVNILCSLSMLVFVQSDNIENIIQGSEIASQPSETQMENNSPVS